MAQTNGYTTTTADEERIMASYWSPTLGDYDWDAMIVDGVIEPPEDPDEYREEWEDED
jgi:hypothetical protein